MQAENLEIQASSLESSPQIALQAFTDSDPVPGTGMGDVRSDLLQRARELARSKDPEHAWLKMGDREMALHSRLLLSETEGRPECLSVAGLLLVGWDHAIRKHLPDRSIETKAQALDPHGFDEQGVLRTNLMDSFQALMEVVRRNLPQGELLEIPPYFCQRDVIFSEIISNMLVHRDYSTPGRSKLTLQRDRLSIENPCKTNRQGLVDLARFESYPKNPVIYAFFGQAGLSGSPGSGMRTLLEMGDAYFGIEPLVFDRTNFKVFAPSQMAYSDSFTSPFQDMQDEAAFDIPKVMSMQDLNGRDGAGEKGRASFSESLNVFAPMPPAVSTKIPENSQKTSNQFGVQVESKENMQADRIQKIIDFCKIPRNREDIQHYIGLNNRDYFRKEILLPLLREGLLVATIPDKPNSPKQQYRTPD